MGSAGLKLEVLHEIPVTGSDIRAGAIRRSLPCTTATAHATGLRQTDQVHAQSERSLSPPFVDKAKINPIKLQGEADELAALAQALPAVVKKANNGMLPKDLNHGLKRIENHQNKLRTEWIE